MTTSHRGRIELTKLTEHLDLKTAAERKIKVGYTPDVLTDAGMICFTSFTMVLMLCSVADISVMLALMAGRNVKESMAVVYGGEVSFICSTHEQMLTYTSMHSG